MKTSSNRGLMVALILLGGILSVSSCKKQKEDPFGILTASLTMPGGRTVVCAVDQEALTISNANDPVEPGMPEAMYQMTLTYTATIGTEVRYNGQAVESGVTQLNLSAPVTLAAVKADKQILYTLTLSEDAADKSQTEGKRVNADMRTAGFPNCAYFDVAWFNGAFYAITSTYPEGTAADNPALYDVYKSTDGISWSEVSTGINVVGGYGARLVVFNNKLWAYGGGRFYGTDEDGNAPESMWGMFPDITRLFLSSTTDGTTWTDETENVKDESGVFNGYVDARLIPSGNKLNYYGGLGCAFGQIQKTFNMAGSTDGVTWSPVTDFDSAGPAAMYSCYALYSFKGTLYLAGGFQNFIDPTSAVEWYHQEVYQSTDGGLTWTVAAEDGGFGPMWNMRVAGNDEVLYMVGGEYFAEDGNGTRELTASNKVYRSTDGVHWTPLTGEFAMPDSFTARTRPSLVASGDMLWIFGGRGHTNGYYGGPDIKDEVYFDTWKKAIK